MCGTTQLHNYTFKNSVKDGCVGEAEVGGRKECPELEDSLANSSVPYQTKNNTKRSRNNSSGF